MRSILCLLACLLAWSGVRASLPEPPPPRYSVYGFVGADGRVIVAPQYRYVSIVPSGDWVGVSDGRKYGFLNLRTGAATGLKFDSAVSDLAGRPLFADGPEPVRMDDKWGYTDEGGRLVIEARFDEAKRFQPDGLAVVKAGGKAGYIDRSGRLTVPGDFHMIRDFHNGFAVVGGNDKWGAIDTKGALVIPLRFDFLGNFTPGGLAPASTDGGIFKKDAHYGFVDRSGRFVIPPVYSYAYGFVEPEQEEGRHHPPGMARVAIREKDGSSRVGYIDPAGRLALLLPPGIVGWLVSRDGLIQFQDLKTAKWGFADMSGRIVIPATFTGTGTFGPNGLAPVRVGDKWGFIAADGGMKIEPVYDSAGNFRADGRAQVSEGRRSFLIDETGNKVVTFPPWLTLPLGPSGYAAIQHFPPRFDHPVRRFGAWTLEHTLYPVPEIPSMAPQPEGMVKLSMKSDDGLVEWTVQTEGWTLNIETEIHPEDSDRSDLDKLDVLPVGAIGLLDYFRRHLDGQSGMSIAMGSTDARIDGERKARVATARARKETYLKQLEESRADLERAWAAMRADVQEQFGGLAGPPCPPERCVY